MRTQAHRLLKFTLISSFVGTVVTLGLGGCSMTPPKSMMDVQANESFVLNQPINIPADTARVFIQYGKLTTRQGFNRQDQHCELEIYHLKHQPQTVEPDHFIISKVRIGSEMIASSTIHKPVMVAEANTGIVSDAQQPWQTWLAETDDNNRVETMDTVRLYLKPTPKNPNIFRLTCSGSLSNGALQDAPRSYRPERTQINQILGPIGHLN